MGLRARTLDLHVEGVGGEGAVEGRQHGHFHGAEHRLHHDHGHGGAEVVARGSLRGGRQTDQGVSKSSNSAFFTMSRVIAAEMRLDQVAHADVPVEAVGSVRDAGVLELAERDRALEVVGMDDEAALRMDLERLVGGAFEIDGDAIGLADDHVVRGGFLRGVYRTHGGSELLLLQDLAADQRQRDAEAAIIAIGLQIVRRDGDAGCVEPGPGKRSGLREGQDVGPVLAAHFQDHGGIRALDLPVPVLGMDEPAVLRDLRHGHDACAAVGILVGHRAARRQDAGRASGSPSWH